MYTTILNVDELSNIFQNADCCILDCRYDLSHPDWGFENYQRAHIPGAQYVHLNHDLSGLVTNKTGRHPLPGSEEFILHASGWGISTSAQVILYDTSGGSMAVRLWWLLRMYGHPAVALLDGGFQSWMQAGQPVSTGIETHNPAAFIGKPDPKFWVDSTFVDRIRLNPGYRLIDTRAAERFRGDVEPIDPVAGHIPGAINRPYALNLKPDGTFKSKHELRLEFTQLIRDISPDHVVTYCGSGVTAAHNVLAMEIAGLSGAKIYAGSWSEWIRSSKYPIAKGDK